MTSTLEPVHIDITALTKPIPNMEKARSMKENYSGLPIDTSNMLSDEPLVKLHSLGIAGQAYYSRPNAATHEAVSGVSPDPYLRRSVAETLRRINQCLQAEEITSFFEGQVELWIQDALRPVSLQERLYEEVFPRLIREQHPGITDEEMKERRQHHIARPSTDPSKPSPHATGGVFDLSLRFKQDKLTYVEGASIELEYAESDTSKKTYPDYYEQYRPTSEKEKRVQRNRRAFYAIMTGAAFNFDSEFICNPTEWWHWGRGDQLSEKVRGSSAAYYSLIEPSK